MSVINVIDVVNNNRVTINQITEEITVHVAELGARGFSAYEIAVQNGYTGTEQEWIDSFKKTWFDYVVGAQASETIETTSEYEIDKLTFPNNRFFYRKSTETTDAIYADEACTVLVVDRVQNL